VSENIQPASEENKIVEKLEEENLSEKPSAVNVEKSSINLEQNRFECRSCGYIYDPSEGNKKLNIPKNTYLILQNTKKPDSRLKSTKFLQKLIKNNLAKEKSFSLPEIWDYEGQKRFLEDAANEMNIKIDTNAAELIIDSVGNDSFKLINELGKAKTYLSALSRDSNSQLFLNSIDVKKYLVIINPTFSKSLIFS